MHRRRQVALGKRLVRDEVRDVTSLPFGREVFRYPLPDSGRDSRLRLV